MRGRAKVLDSRFMEFIECLQKIGELKNMVRMIMTAHGVYMTNLSSGIFVMR